jgi:hypothetical protein
MTTRKWNLQTCFESAQNFETTSRWQKGAGGAFNSARRNGWFKHCVMHMRNGRAAKKWTKEACLTEALKFRTKNDWWIHSRSSYNACLKRGWHREASAHMELVRGKWTKKAVVADAAKYKTRSDWRKHSAGAYSTAVREKWLQHCTQHMTNLVRKWTKQICMDDAKKYNSRRDWCKASKNAYSAAQWNGWLSAACAHMKRLTQPTGYWTKTRCHAEARKYASRKIFMLASRGAYAAARENGWLEAICGHMSRPANGARRTVYWFVDRFEKYAYVGLSDHPEERAKAHFREKKILRDSLEKGTLEYYELGEYLSEKKAQVFEAQMIRYWRSRRYAIVNIAKAGSLGGNVYKWTKEACIADAKKYKSRKEWQLKSGGAFNSARRKGWYAECCKYLPDIKRIWTKENCALSASKYQVKEDWRLAERGAHGAAMENGWLADVCAHMIKGKRRRKKNAHFNTSLQAPARRIR